MTPTEKKAFSRRPFEYISADLAYKLLKGDYKKRAQIDLDYKLLKGRLQKNEGRDYKL
jgi:hypothetical protein